MPSISPPSLFFIDFIMADGTNLSICNLRATVQIIKQTTTTINTISSPFLSLLLFTFGRDEPSTGKDNADSSSFYTLPSNGSSIILQNIDPNLGFSSDDGVKVPEIIHSGIELMPRRMLYVLKKMEMTMMTRRAKEEMAREMGFRSRI